MNLSKLLATACVLLVSAPALAAPPVAHAAIQQADYYYHGHHYHYKYDGHYYDHREKHDNGWRYY